MILFEEALEYCEAIVCCYSKWTIVRIYVHVPTPFTWHVAQMVVDLISLVVSACVLNQSHGHWLLTNAFHFAITMNTKLMGELKNPPSSNKIMDENLGMVHELTLLALTIKKGSLLFFILFYFGKIWKKKTHRCCP